MAEAKSEQRSLGTQDSVKKCDVKTNPGFTVKTNIDTAENAAEDSWVHQTHAR